MEDLGLPDEAYDIVTGFNSFQYADNIGDALAEARRVLKPGGRLVVMIWGNKEDCQAAVSLGAMSALLPPLPPGTPGPFALSEQQLLEKTLERSRFTIIQTNDIASVWDFPDIATTLRGLLSAGPAYRAIHRAGYDRVAEVVNSTLPQFTRPDGHVIFNNKWRVVIAKK
jgi:SAM-dependent methyltransferase